MTTTQTSVNTQEKKSAKKKQQSFPRMDIGAPQVPLRKSRLQKQQHELLSDWEHAS
ncbi:hypothetical protein [Calothrix sp. PCC 7507]|uniref:hypothetical protein n=1 Tax=Calothrix sp. PCC 7507 TaxID=99598 RepID=UPI00029EF4DF|nr:hypothetical protein [Calothrix sp. PCC 7507]AFY30888.1 hypothetical protein Cal7507_0393 [Calothrix sp. PCC 7507]